METLHKPHLAADPFPLLYHQLVYTLTGLLPPPLDGSPEALRARNHAAVAKVAALLPVGASELDLATHCVAARAQAEEMLRLVRQNEDDVGLVLRLNAQYGSMVRTSLAVHGRLMRVQAVRQKRETIEGAANQDAWVQHIVEQSMLAVAEPRARESEAARQGVAPVAVPVAAPAAGVEEGAGEGVSDNGTNSHGVAFETGMSGPPRHPGGGADDARLREDMRAAVAGSLIARARLAVRGISVGGV